MSSQVGMFLPCVCDPQVLEDHGVGMEKKLLGGKAGDLSVMLRASATQLKTRQFKVRTEPAWCCFFTDKMISLTQLCIVCSEVTNLCY